MKYSDDQRLKILRSIDDWREWRSLDDERLCIECAHLMTGRDVVVTAAGDGRFSVNCPTPGCNSTPRDWFYHGARDARALANIAQTA
jgi:hypothetical protein